MLTQAKYCICTLVCTLYTCLVEEETSSFFYVNNSTEQQYPKTISQSSTVNKDFVVFLKGANLISLFVFE